jgi:dienelactone hydrolase
MRQEPSICRRAFLQGSGGALGLSLAGAFARAEEPAQGFRFNERASEMARRAPLAMRFDGSTADECRVWQARFGAKLKEMLGPFQPPARWETTLEQTVTANDHVREERLLRAEGLDPLPFHLLLPRGETAARARAASDGKALARRPAVLALHGHGPLGYDAVVGKAAPEDAARDIAPLHYDYGLELVKRGYIVAAPCFTPFGRRAPAPKKKGAPVGDACGPAFMSLQILGKLLIAENLRDVLWTLDYLTSLPQVDPARIGCVGLSYGGRMTMLATALEPRIRVAAVSGALNVFQERVSSGAAAGCQVIPGLLEQGDVPEIASLIAPRPAVWEAGNKDALIDPTWAEVALVRMRRAYRAFGVENLLQVDHFEGRHEWHGTLAYPLLDQVLKAPT